MKTLLAVGIMMGAALQGAEPFAGRWDLTVTTPKDTYPSWMEFSESGGKPKVRVVGRVASVHPATDVKVDGARLTFTTSEWFDGQTKVTWDLQAAGGKATGTEKRADGVEGQIVGVPAPALKHAAPAAWGKPEAIFDGKDLNGWEPDDAAHNHWVAQSGELVNQAAGANIRTTRKFGDFKLHIEYNCPDGGNSGVYLRGGTRCRWSTRRPGRTISFTPWDRFTGSWRRRCRSPSGRGNGRATK